MNRFEKALEWSLATKTREYALVLLLFLALTVVFTWPLVLHLHNGVIGGRGDPMLNAWIISWDAKTIFTNPSGLFQGNIIYPSRDVLAYSEHLFAMGILTAPVYFISGNPVLSYNLLVVFAAVLSGFGCYLLVKELTSSRWAGLAAGVFFAFCPYKLSKLGHLHVFFSPFLPFALLYEYRYLRKGGKWNLVLFGVFFLAQALSSWHYLIFTSLVVASLWLWVAVFTRRREGLMRLLGIVAAVAAAAIIIVPFALPYLRAHDRLPGFERSMDELEGYAATPEDFLRVLPENLVYGDAAPAFELPGERGESVFFPGFVVLVFALLGLAALWAGRGKEAGGGGEAGADDAGGGEAGAGKAGAGKKGDGREIFPFRRGAAFPFLLLLLGFVLVLGPEPHGISNPPFIAMFHLGLLKFIRVPSRFYVIVALALAMLAGYGMAWLVARLRAGGGKRGLRRAAPFCLLLILVFELMSVNFTIAEVPVGGEVPEVYSWLEQQGDVRVIELPTSYLSPAVSNDRDLGLAFTDVLGFHESEATVVYFSTYHWKKIVNGYSGYFPYHYRRTITEMQGFPSQRSLELLRALGIDYVVWNWEAVQPQRREEFNVRLFSVPGLSMVEDFGDYTVFGVETGPVVGAEALDVGAFGPDTVLPGEDFNLGLIARNRGGAPFISLEEGSQRYQATFADAEGTTVSVQDGEFWGPFFLRQEEAVSIPLCLKAPRESGRYRLQLALREGVLGERSFTFDVDVGEIPVSTQPAGLDGTISIVGGETIGLASPDGLLPLSFEVENAGDTLWKATTQDKEPDEVDVGLVRIGVSWEQKGVKVWEDQRCNLPGDIAPGQEVTVSTLVRPPPVPGAFTMRVGLVCEFFGWFGNSLEIEVEIENWMREETREAPAASGPAPGGYALPAAHLIEAA
ncbi:MAG: hypothetical protein PHS26_08700 [Actinomycetota bacterium]|nr:hypothetical protein [Actinomycetota bacterium]